jgi:hypothetical protein
MLKRILISIALVASLGGAVAACNTPAGTSSPSTSLPSISVPSTEPSTESSGGASGGASDMLSSPAPSAS